MYLTFFGLREKPFNLTPDPKFLYLNASYREALAALRYGINERKGFVSLIGEAGTGKTTLLRRLLTELAPDVRTVLVLNPAVGFDELLAFILADLGHPPAPATPKLQLLQALNAELLDTLSRGGNVVVLIDEAQDLSIPVLEELRLLSNLETAKEKILQFVLAGQPELDRMLARPELRQLRQRIAVPARVRPLERGEVAAYVAARIAAAGGDARGLFTAAALRQLHAFSRGIPRLVNVACDSALVTAYAAGTRLVDRKIMRDAIRDLGRGPYETPPASVWRVRLATVAAAGVIGAIVGIAVSRLATGSFAWRPASAQPSAAVPRVIVTAAPAALAASEPTVGATLSGETRVAAAEPAAALATTAALASPAPIAVTSGGAGDAPTALPVPATASPSAPAPTVEAAASAAVVAAPSAASATPVAAPRAVAASAPPATAAPSRTVARTPRALRSPRPTVVRGAEEEAASAPSRESSAGERQVVVRKGDDLTHIARRSYGYVTSELLDAIQDANPESLVDRDRLSPGQVIVLPPDPGQQQVAPPSDIGLPVATPVATPAPTPAADAPSP